MTEWEKKSLESAKADLPKQPDDFWDIESLLPAKSTRRPMPSPPKSTEAVEVDVPLSPRANGTKPQSVGSSPEAVSSSSLTVRYVPPHKAG